MRKVVSSLEKGTLEPENMWKVNVAPKTKLSLHLFASNPSRPMVRFVKDDYTAFCQNNLGFGDATLVGKTLLKFLHNCDFLCLGVGDKATGAELIQYVRCSLCIWRGPRRICGFERFTYMNCGIGSKSSIAC